MALFCSCGILRAQAESAIVITELHTNPDVKTEQVEFIELHNAGETEMDLSGWQFTEGVLYAFPVGTKLRAGGYLVVVGSPAGFQSKWNSGRSGPSESLVFGPWTGGLDNDGEKIVLRDAAGVLRDEVEYQLGFPWPTVGDPVPETVPGSGYSMQLVDPAFDNNLGGNWRSGPPTPAGANRNVSASNLPPCVRQVKHSPKQPKSNEVVTITAKVTDRDGVASVTLYYQPVDPGAYFSRADSRFWNDWTAVPMHDDGLAGDARAGDDVYTVQLPASVQTHRRLVRYKITVADNLGSALTVPYADDPQPNFAYFVYDGVPAWRGAVQPGVTPIVEYPAEVMQSLPVYHLLSKKADVEDSTWLSHDGGSEYRWYGTLVYDGDVYDHIRYRARGGVWRYAMGKNMWKMDFQRGHYFQARDDYGHPYKTRWNKLNFSACIQQGSFGQRGEQGMFEALSFRLFNLAGCPASKTNYVHFRIIDETYEDGTRNASHPPLTTGGTQYDGDFWGLYLTIEQLDGRFLDEHDLPDGNLYKMEGGGVLNNQGPTQPTNGSDLNQFLSYGDRSESWWRANVNLPAYYGYYAVYQAVHDGDITEKNWFLYHNPLTNQWTQLPWDKDLTWTTYYGSNDPSDPFSRAGVLNVSALGIEAKNRLREITDLLFNPDQTNQLIDEFAALINDPAGGPSIVDADCAMWNYHWVVGNGAYPKYLNQPANFKAGQNMYYQEAADQKYSRSFEGMVQVMKNYVKTRGTYLDTKSADAAIPNTPTITATGPADFPANALTFRTSPFSDPQGAGTFGAMRWRIAEVSPGLIPSPTMPATTGTSTTTTGPSTILLPDGSTWKYFKGTQEPSTPTSAWRQPGFNDSTWSSGSAPIGYGETFLSTTLSDMQGHYTSLYFRKTFNLTGLAAFQKLALEVKFDDGVNVWINGKLAYQNNVAGENQPYSARALTAIENWAFVSSSLGDPRSWLVEGTNVIAVQVLNADIASSSDCFLDVRLSAQRAAGATSGTSTTTETVASSLYRKTPGKYEINAAWDSGETPAFNSNITIPATAVTPGHVYRVRCRMKDNTGRWSHWSSPVEFTAGEPLAASMLENLRITELMYNPPAWPGDTFESNEYEFVELKNIGIASLNLTGVLFDKGITFNFAGNNVLALGPGQFVLVVKNQAAFLSRYGPALAGLIAGEYQGKLANDGETVSLVDRTNGTIVEFQYGDGRGWPKTADGAGHSLVPLDSALAGESQGSLNYACNWRASTYLGGSPGQDDPTPPATVLINELSASTPLPGGQAGQGNDWIELYNPTNAAVNLSGWYLSDKADEPNKWPIPAVSIPAHGYLVFDEASGFGKGANGFGLSRDGEEVVLSYLPGTGQDRIVDCVSFKAQEPGVSLGRYPDGGPYWLRLEPSPAAANKNPILDVVVDEIMYHPVDPNEEYVELYNPTAREVSLSSATASWRLDGAVSYPFPAGTSIAAGGRLVVVGFDPIVGTSRRNAFLTAYGAAALTPPITLVGPWTGSLSNQGERIALEKSQPGDNAAVPIAWVLVDEVVYGAAAPWPIEPAGQGSVLQRIHTQAGYSGSDPTNWKAAPPSPGR